MNCGADLSAAELSKPPAGSRVDQAVMQPPLTALDMSSIHTVSPETPLEVAVHALNRQKLDILGVAENGRLIGLLSVRDIMMRVGSGYKQKLSLPVRQFMTLAPETLPPDAPIAFAVNKMDVGGYRHVPVEIDGRVVGVVSSRDVVRYLVKHGREAGPIAP